MNLLPVILAGGGGTRLWPLSRGHFPKQFLSVVGDKTLLQDTLIRMPGDTALPFSVQAPMVVCNEEHRFMVGEQARQSRCDLSSIVLEPIGRNTAPALTCAALLAIADGDDPLLLMMPADQLIADVEGFRQCVVAGAAAAEAGALVTFGVVPDKPETGYGYIQLGAMLDTGALPSHSIAAFREKPDLDTATAYLADGGYRWNAGIFLMRASVWLRAIETFNPEIAAASREAV
ncbi:MAG: mannose-1-phosphate guanylyltransferase, partial [Gammaproteobacteria bacterium]